MARVVFAIGQVRRDVCSPVLVLIRYRFEPGGNTGLTAVNLLSTADQADYDGAVVRTIGIREQEFRLGLAEASTVFLAAHEIRRDLAIPRALRFVEDYDAIRGRAGVPETSISEMMHILDEGLDRLLDDALA